MNEFGIIRRVDDLGRIVIPKEIRKALRIREGDALEIFTSKDSITYKKYSPISVGCEAKNAHKALLREGLKFAIYDTSGIVSEGGASGEFSTITPEVWLEHREESVSFGDKTVFPIIACGELLGFIAVLGSEKLEYVLGVARTLSASLLN